MKKLLFISMVALSVIAGGCKKKKEADPCEGKVCLNGGYCQSGTCACPTGYTGSDCGTQVTPSKIRLDSIWMKKFPALDGTDNWDSNIIDNPKPDIYIKINDSTNTNLLSNINDRISNANSQPYKLPINPLDFTNYGMKYKIIMYDYDGVGSDENMGESTFFVYNSTNKFPKKIVVSNTAGTIEYELYLSYTY